MGKRNKKSEAESAVALKVSPHIAIQQNSSIQKKKVTKPLTTKAKRRKFKAIEKACAVEEKLEKRIEDEELKVEKAQIRKKLWE
ncbi:hypothetical protein IWQ60_002853 [Tieghemiomyces parasiticus]|uniref:Uncharacterized protein n=1 Tax=Tieghemiomyces parasiticus TaxID=78921 RepID=A0A9W8AGM9_9FUNG|nr:hypothetical protein IWQ60_002853 [Tieghemiomyces parasiticus]